MTEQRPGVDDSDEPGGTAAPRGSLTEGATTPGEPDQSPPRAAPGTYEADEDDQRRGRGVKPGN